MPLNEEQLDAWLKANAGNPLLEHTTEGAAYNEQAAVKLSQTAHWRKCLLNILVEIAKQLAALRQKRSSARQ